MNNLREVFNTSDDSIVLSKINFLEKCLKYKEAQFGSEFGMKFDCKSPFVSARITWDGNVNICHNKVIGNVNEKTLEAIWNGREAKTIRRSLLKIVVNA